MDKITKKTKFSFALGGLGYHLYVGIVMNYLLIFYTDVMGIAAGAVATLFLVTRIWDAVNDPMMGMLVDRTRNKRFGKFRIYLLSTPLPLAIVFVLMFTVFDLGPGAKLVYAYVTYTLYGMLYTVYEVPYWGISSILTNSTKERSSLISTTKVFQMIGILIAIGAAMPLVSALGGENADKGWFLMALIIGVLGLFFTQLPSIGIKQNKRLEAGNSGNVLKSFGRLLKHNKPLWMVTIALGITFFTVMSNSLAVHFVVYNLGRPELVPIAGLVPMLLTILGMTFVPKLIKAVGDKKKLLIWATVIDIILKAAFYLIGYQGLPLVIVFAAMGCFGLIQAVPIVVTQIMYADCIEYNEMKTGERNEGIIFSLKSFMEKMRLAIGGAAGAWLLALINYVPNQQQTAETLNGLFFGMTIVPAIGMVIFIILMLFYPLTDKKHEEIVKQLENK